MPPIFLALISPTSPCVFKQPLQVREKSAALLRQLCEDKVLLPVTVSAKMMADLSTVRLVKLGITKEKRVYFLL